MHHFSSSYNQIQVKHGLQRFVVLQLILTLLASSILVFPNESMAEESTDTGTEGNKPATVDTANQTYYQQVETERQASAPPSDSKLTDPNAVQDITLPPDRKTTTDPKQILKDTLAETTAAATPAETPAVKVNSSPVDADNGLRGLKGKYETDLFTGGGSFTYPFDLPPGRNGMTPAVSLNYSTLNSRLDSMYGYGWEMNNSYIVRSSNKGTDKLYTEKTYTASIFGSTEELVLVNATTGEYRPKVEGSYRIYTLSNNTWSMKDKQGNQYLFGAAAATRQDNPADANKIYKWMLEKVTDTNANFMALTYFKDKGQIYPDTINYTGNGTAQGINQVKFLYEVRPVAVPSFPTAFSVTTAYRLKTVNLNLNYGSGYETAYAYQLAYNDAFSTKSFLSQIQLSSGTATIPATQFTYTTVDTNKLPGLLSGIQTPYGGVTSVTYKSSPQYRDGANRSLNSKLFLNIQTVNSVTVKNSATDTPKTTNYVYQGGHYYYDNLDAYKREYAGFQEVDVTDPSGNVQKLYFHQSEFSPDNAASAAKGEYQDHLSKKGKIYREEVYDNANKLFQVTIRRWERTDLGNGRNFPYNYEVVNQTYDGTTSHRDSAHVYVYNSYGELSAERDWGEVIANDNGSYADTGPASEIVRHVYTYAVNTSTYVVATPCLISTTDSNSVELQKTVYYYDDQAYCQVTKGNRIKQLDWLKEENRWLTTQWTYNTYGLVTAMKDPKNNTTTIVYDSKNLYPYQTTNAKGHVTTTLYDYRSGQIKELTDPNGAKTTNSYDGFLRLTEVKVTDPANVTAQKTVRTMQYFDTAVPFKLVATDFNGQPGDAGKASYSYYDGFGKLLQSRTAAEGVYTYTVSSISYDEKNRVKKQTLPVFEISSNYNPVYASQANTLNYDALDRVTSMVNALGTTGTAYDKWTKTVTDANQHTKKLYFNSYGSLIQVDEKNGTATYPTVYTYDTLQRLTKITDAENNIRNFLYDSLGRLKNQDMLHKPTAGNGEFGSWSYTYDDNGNVVTKTDPNNQVNVYAYDSLNRLLTEDFSGQVGIEVSNEYDTGTYRKGRLYKVNVSGLERVWSYDILGRTTQVNNKLEARSLDTFQTYDLLGNVLTLKSPNNKITTYVYNNAYQVNAINSDLLGPVVTNIDYNPAGSTAVMQYGNGVTTTNTYDYNQLYRLTNKKTQKDGAILQDISYTFDPVGNVQTIAENAPTAAKRFAVYGYDDLDRLLSATITQTGNGEDVTQTFTYSPTGNMLTNSLLGSYLYEGTNNANPQAVTKVGTDRTFGYDRNGNVVSSTKGGTSNALIYDYRNNLISSQMTSGGEQMAVSINQRLIGNDPSYAEVTEGGQLGTVGTETGSGSVLDETLESSTDKKPEIENEIESNPSKVTGDKPIENEFEPIDPSLLNRNDLMFVLPGFKTKNTKVQDSVTALEATNTVTHNVTYSYAAGYERFRKYDETTDQNSWYLGDYEIESTGHDTTLSVKKRRINIQLNGQQIASLEHDAVANTFKLYYHHTDHLTGSSVETDQSGYILQVLDYLPFGGTRVDEQLQSYANKKKFTGKELDTESGLYYYGARYYDADIGRWMGYDPLQLELKRRHLFSPQKFNGYAYVLNNPLKYVDADGYENGNPFVDFAGGVLYSLADNFSGGYLTKGIKPLDSKAFKAGKLFGDVVSLGTGITGMTTGIATTTSGLVLVPETGPGGVVVTAAGVTLTAESAAVAARAGTGIVELFGGGTGDNGYDNFSSSSAGDGAFGLTKNLNQQLAAEEAMNNPASKTIFENSELFDETKNALTNNYGAGDWVKQAYNHSSLDGTNIEIHYYENLTTGQKVEFKPK